MKKATIEVKANDKANGMLLGEIEQFAALARQALSEHGAVAPGGVRARTGWSGKLVELSVVVESNPTPSTFASVSDG